MNEFKYEIGDKTYIQRPLVLGQMRQLTNTIKGLVIPADVDTLGLISALGDKLPLAIAIVLTLDGAALKDKDIYALAADIEFEILPEQTLQVIEDFFECNPIASLLESIGKMTEGISKAMNKMRETGSNPSSASLPGEILPEEMESSGTTH